MRLHLFACSLVLLGGGLAHAQNFSTAPCSDNGGSSSGWFFGSSGRACELRRAVLPVNNGKLGVIGTNGGMEVVGEDRSDIALEARVSTQASSREEAEALLHQVRIVTTGDIHAEGPHDEGWSRRSWSVSYKLKVPRRLNVGDFRTSNGGITVANIEGNVSAGSTNGGLSLHDLGGSVHAETTNGGINISLAGEHWRGGGLYARSTNGGISVRVPEHFAAHLQADTTNGGVAVDFPTSGSDDRHRTHLDTNINGGGPPVRLETTNGGISLGRL